MVGGEVRRTGISVALQSRLFSQIRADLKAAPDCVCWGLIGSRRIGSERKSRRAGRLLLSLSLFFSPCFPSLLADFCYSISVNATLSPDLVNTQAYAHPHTLTHRVNWQVATRRCGIVLSLSRERRAEVPQGAWTQSHITAAFTTLIITALLWLLSFVRSVGVLHQRHHRGRRQRAEQRDIVTFAPLRDITTDSITRTFEFETFRSILVLQDGLRSFSETCHIYTTIHVSHQWLFSVVNPILT